MLLKIICLLFLIVFFMAIAESKIYCLDNETLAIEKEMEFNISEEEKNMTFIETRKCNCINDSCYHNGFTIIEFLAFFIISFMLMHLKNRILSIIGSLAFLMSSVFLLVNPIIIASSGIPSIKIESNLLKTLSFIFIGYAIVKIFHSLTR